MSPIDYYTLNLELINQYNSTFEYWLTISFAFIVAFHFVSKELGVNLSYFVVSLYGFTALVMVIRFTARNIAVGNLHEAMTSNGVPLPPWNDGGIGDLVFPGMFWIMVIGTLGAIFFSILMMRREK